MTTTTEAPLSANDDRVVPGSLAHSDGAGAFVPVQTRSERPHSFVPADFPVPNGREVNWRYTPVARLAPLFEDVAGPEGVMQVDVTAPEGVEQARLAKGAAPRGEVFRPEDLPSAIAWEQETEAPLLRIPANLELDEPVFVNLTGTGGLAHATSSSRRARTRARPSSSATPARRSTRRTSSSSCATARSSPSSPCRSGRMTRSTSPRTRHGSTRTRSCATSS